MIKIIRLLLAVCMTALVTSSFGAWVNISAGLLAGKTPDWPGGIGGCAVNRLNGDVYVKICGLGIYKSSDQGTSYTRIDANTVSGRDETGAAWDQDWENPTRMATFSLDGNAGGSLDGTTWKMFANVGRNWDYGSVDWVSTTPSVMIVTQHESGGIVRLSTNGGTSWSQMNINIMASGAVDAASAITMVGVLDANTLIYCKGGGIYRSTNQGGAWSQVSSSNSLTRTPHVFKGVAYLGNSSGLLVSSDNGATWHQQGGAVVVNQGPYFGADENSMVVANQQGLYKTTNAGQTWTKLPPTTIQSSGAGNFDPRWYGHYAWDPIHNIIYASSMGNPAYKWELGPVSASGRKSESIADKKISFGRSTIHSKVLLSKVEIYSPLGRLLYRNILQTPSFNIILPQYLNTLKTIQLITVTDNNGEITRAVR